MSYQDIISFIKSLNNTEFKELFSFKIFSLTVYCITDSVSEELDEQLRKMPEFRSISFNDNKTKYFYPYYGRLNKQEKFLAWLEISKLLNLQPNSGDFEISITGENPYTHGVIPYSIDVLNSKYESRLQNSTKSVTFKSIDIYPLFNDSYLVDIIENFCVKQLEML